MWQFIVAIILFVLALGAIAVSFFLQYDEDRRGVRIGSAVGILVGLVFMFFSATYSVGVGEGKIVVNCFSKTYERTISTPGFGFKAPWEDFVDFDLLSLQLAYAGDPNDPPTYTKGKVDGAEVTVTVGGIAGGSTSANVDILLSYNVDPDNIEEIYANYKTQDNFTKQIVEPIVLEVIRTVPSGYSAVDFRGVKRSEAGQTIMNRINERLKPYGVQITNVSIQSIRYSTDVEQSLTGLEVAAQNKEKAKLEADAAVTKAKGEAQAKIEQAKGEAQSNKLLNDSLTDKVLAARQIEAIKSAGEHGSVIVTNGKTIVQTAK